MKPGAVIPWAKPDKRYKPGRIVIKNGQLRGHPDTVNMKTYTIPPPPKDAPMFNILIEHQELSLNPPMVITKEMADKLRDMRIA